MSIEQVRAPRMRHSYAPEREMTTRGIPVPPMVDPKYATALKKTRAMEGSAALPEAAPPVKKASWEWYLPVYFWLGGAAAGAWLAATAEDWGGAGDRAVVRTARYLTLGSILGGTGLLIADLGRSERFLNMLRVFHTRSAMSLGSWGLTAFGTVAGVAGALQVAEDTLGPDSLPGRLSRGAVGRAVHLAGLAPALFVGTYTGALLASTSTPTWARGRLTLPPLFMASGAASGIAATAALVDRRRSVSTGARRRLARAAAVALAAELALALANERAVASLPSQRNASPQRKTARALTLLAGTAVPLLLTAYRARKLDRPLPRLRREAKLPPPRRALGSLLAGALALGGSLALRFQITRDGLRSADTAADTWALTGHAPGGAPLRNPPKRIK